MVYRLQIAISNNFTIKISKFHESKLKFTLLSSALYGITYHRLNSILVRIFPEYHTTEFNIQSISWSWKFWIFWLIFILVSRNILTRIYSGVQEIFCQKYILMYRKYSDKNIFWCTGNILTNIFWYWGNILKKIYSGIEEIFW